MKGESPNPYRYAPPVISEQDGYHCIDLDEIVNGNDSVRGVPE
jgi:hypothetical protein